MFPWNHLGDVPWNSVTSVRWSYFCFLHLYICRCGLMSTSFVCSGCSSASHSVPVDPVIEPSLSRRTKCERGHGAAPAEPLSAELVLGSGPGWDEKNTLLWFHLCRAAAGVDPAQMAAEGRRRGEINSRCERCTDRQRGWGSARTQPDPPEPLSSDLFMGER